MSDRCGVCGDLIEQDAFGYPGAICIECRLDGWHAPDEPAVDFDPPTPEEEAGGEEA